MFMKDKFWSYPKTKRNNLFNNLVQTFWMDGFPKSEPPLNIACSGDPNFDERFRGARIKIWDVFSSSRQVCPQSIATNPIFCHIPSFGVVLDIRVNLATSMIANLSCMENDWSRRNVFTHFRFLHSLVAGGFTWVPKRKSISKSEKLFFGIGNNTTFTNTVTLARWYFYTKTYA